MRGAAVRVPGRTASGDPALPRGRAVLGELGSGRTTRGRAVTPDRLSTAGEEAAADRSETRVAAERGTTRAVRATAVRRGSSLYRTAGAGAYPPTYPDPAASLPLLT